MNKIDKIYFDIDEVLKGTASPQEDVIALIRYCLDNYGSSLYWLTTHYKGGRKPNEFCIIRCIPCRASGRNVSNI